MTLSAARAAAAQAIDDATDDNVQVVEVDVLSDRQIPALAKGLTEAHLGAADGTGPAFVAVMATGRRASQAIGITAVLIIRDRVGLDLDWSGRGRGLAVHDVVEDALAALPTHGLPELLVESSIEQLPVASESRNVVQASDPYVALHVYTLHVEWPPAFPSPPLATADGGALGAIRTHVGDAIEAAFGTGDERRGDTAVRQRSALRDGEVPRAAVELERQYDVVGGDPNDLKPIPDLTWIDDQDRTWTAAAVAQTVVARAFLWHRTFDLADAAARGVVAELQGSSVVWPGNFDARVVEGGAVVTRALTGGTYRQEVRALSRLPATWDAEHGLARAEVQMQVYVVEPTEPAKLIAPVARIVETKRWI